jgi:hypothetical protein
MFFTAKNSLKSNFFLFSAGFFAISFWNWAENPVFHTFVVCKCCFGSSHTSLYRKTRRFSVIYSINCSFATRNGYSLAPCNLRHGKWSVTGILPAAGWKRPSNVFRTVLSPPKCIFEGFFRYMSQKHWFWTSFSRFSLHWTFLAILGSVFPISGPTGLGWPPKGSGPDPPEIWTFAGAKSATFVKNGLHYRSIEVWVWPKCQVEGGKLCFLDFANGPNSAQRMLTSSRSSKLKWHPQTIKNNSFGLGVNTDMLSWNFAEVPKMACFWRFC